jgi:hypothetical protein
MCGFNVCLFSVLRTDGILKNALPLYRLRHLLVLTTCGIIYLHGYAVLLVVADRQGGSVQEKHFQGFSAYRDFAANL